jgi:hypothetical protein
LISTLYTDSENIYIDYKFNGPFSIEHPLLLITAFLKLGLRVSLNQLFPYVIYWFHSFKVPFAYHLITLRAPASGTLTTIWKLLN